MSTGNFKACLDLLLIDEGGWVDHDPGTQGPPTNKGITLDAFRKWHQDLGVHPCITLLGPTDLRSISDQDTAKFYWQLFWTPLKAEQLPKGLDYALFDAAVMSGQERAVKWLQDALGITMDGVIGPQTLEAAQSADNDTVKKLCAARSDFLKMQPMFTKNPGWLPRVNRVEQAACKWLDRPVAPIEDLAGAELSPTSQEPARPGATETENDNG